MKEIEDKIREKGKVIGEDILKVDSFLNHQIDVALLRSFAKEVALAFKGRVNKVLTIETSGIAVAYPVAEELGDLPLVFAKKSKSAIVGDELYRTDIKSFTRGSLSQVTISKDYLKKGDLVLIVDDFLAEGNAALGLIDLCEQAEAKVIGVAIAIEKRFQGGHDALAKRGVEVLSGASISSFKDGKVFFE